MWCAGLGFVKNIRWIHSAVGSRYFFSWIYIHLPRAKKLFESFLLFLIFGQPGIPPKSTPWTRPATGALRPEVLPSTSWAAALSEVPGMSWGAETATSVDGSVPWLWLFFFCLFVFGWFDQIFYCCCFVAIGWLVWFGWVCLVGGLVGIFVLFFLSFLLPDSLKSLGSLPKLLGSLGKSLFVGLLHFYFCAGCWLGLELAGLGCCVVGLLLVVSNLSFWVGIDSPFGSSLDTMFLLKRLLALLAPEFVQK